MPIASLPPDDSPESPRRGRGIDVLGPSDTSDSGSDVAGVGDADTADPSEPVDVGTRDESGRSPLPAEGVDTSTDSSGTGERRSAAGDAGADDAPDISVDSIVDARGAGVDDSDDIDESDGIASEDPRDRRPK